MWVHPCFFSIVQFVLFFLLGWSVRLEVRGRTAAILWGCCFLDLFKIVRSILVLFASGFFSGCFVKVNVVHQCSSSYTAIAWKNLPFSDENRCSYIGYTNFFSLTAFAEWNYITYLLVFLFCRIFVRTYSFF